MSNFQRTSIVVLTDKTFPRGPDGLPDVPKFAEFVANADLAMAHFLLIADGYPGPNRDDVLIETVRDLGWEIVFLNTTRSLGNEYERSFDWWMRRTPLAAEEIVMYGRGLW